MAVAPPGKSYQVSILYRNLSGALYGAYKPFDMVCATANYSFKFHPENEYLFPQIEEHCKFIKMMEADAMKRVRRIAESDCRILTSVFEDRQDELPIPLDQQEGIWSTVFTAKRNKYAKKNKFETSIPPSMKYVHQLANRYSELVACPTLFER